MFFNQQKENICLKRLASGIVLMKKKKIDMKGGYSFFFAIVFSYAQSDEDNNLL